VLFHLVRTEKLGAQRRLVPDFDPTDTATWPNTHFDRRNALARYAQDLADHRFPSYPGISRMARLPRKNGGPDAVALASQPTFVLCTLCPAAHLSGSAQTSIPERKMRPKERPRPRTQWPRSIGANAKMDCKYKVWRAPAAGSAPLSARRHGSARGCGAE
jgi:hypothetical protein